jgi:SAM-dependent methyltransferase
VSVAYRLMYRLGFTPWDAGVPPELADIITGPSALPAARALDLGSGKGGKAIYMAQHGWQVAAVENVPVAMRAARRRADTAGVRIDFRQADVTRLAELGLEPGYSLFFDFGCYHGLNPAQRAAYGRGVESLAAPGATLLLMGFTRPLPPVLRGVTEAGLQTDLGEAWKPVSTRPITTGTSAMNRGSGAWFRFRRA